MSHQESLSTLSARKQSDRTDLGWGTGAALSTTRIASRGETVVRQERSERARQAVLDSAVELLVDQGIGGLTTRAVQRHSGLSRGAFLHHFPTREDLLAATAAELVGRRAARADELIQRLDRERPTNRLRASIETGRDLFAGPDFLAEQELWNAARTDPALRASMRPVVEDLDRRIAEQLPRLFGADLAAHPRFATVAVLSVELAAGMAIVRAARGDRGQKRLLDAWCEAAALLLADRS